MKTSKTYRYKIFCAKLITAEKSENHEYYLEKVSQYWCPHVTEKIEYLPLNYRKLVGKRKKED